jgi:hypothetical protein
LFYNLITPRAAVLQQEDGAMRFVVMITVLMCPCVSCAKEPVIFERGAELKVEAGDDSGDPTSSSRPHLDQRPRVRREESVP